MGQTEIEGCGCVRASTLHICEMVSVLIRNVAPGRLEACNTAGDMHFVMPNIWSILPFCSPCQSVTAFSSCLDQRTQGVGSSASLKDTSQSKRMKNCSTLQSGASIVRDPILRSRVTSELLHVKEIPVVRNGRQATVHIKKGREGLYVHSIDPINC